MEFADKPLFNRFKKVMLSLLPTDRVAVIHHTDPDGVCSGVIAAKLVENIRGKQIDLRINQKGSEVTINSSTVEILKRNNINRVIITDLAVDELPETLLHIARFATVVVLDHHKVYNKINDENVLLIKPQIIFKDAVESSGYCASKLCFDLGSKIADIKNLDWVCTIGVIGDLGARFWKPFVKKVYKKYSVEWHNDLFTTEFGQAASVLSSAESFNINNVELCFRVVYNSHGPKDVLKSPLHKYKEEIQRELDYWLDNAEKLAHYDHSLDLIYYEMEPKHEVKSPVSTLLSLRNPNKTIIVADVRDANKIFLSARRQDRAVAVNELFTKAMKGLRNASGGGHAVAAGGIVPRTEYAKFKRRIIELLKKRH